ncbi:hypothetical protein GCM10007242_16490 [Pigmentiphaga litoralis]|uniref:DUF1799 domain-containing protein n=1 Tax=Pigmentiphaga litoralis TaxID=516702 RepID=UPI00198D6F90|nr:DUF1799 domain-containing protein [Pigmentiphaga litoralis]GGX11134.1 hypothetical protein GCM10007242_16490 [Pigmentiphaga litoralis]
MYWTAPGQKELDNWGLTMADVMPAAVEMWPDNVLIQRVFRTLQTQWVLGGTGKPTGLNYASLSFVMRRCGVPRKDMDDVFDGIQVMEAAALDQMYKG